MNASQCCSSKVMNRVMATIFFFSGVIFVGALIFVITMSANPYLFVDEKYLPIEDQVDKEHDLIYNNASVSNETLNDQS